MLIDLRTKFPEITGKKVENTLVLSHITVNKNMVPFDSRSPFLTSGLEGWYSGSYNQGSEGRAYGCHC